MSDNLQQLITEHVSMETKLFVTKQDPLGKLWTAGVFIQKSYINSKKFCMCYTQKVDGTTKPTCK